MEKNNTIRYCVHSSEKNELQFNINQMVSCGSCSGIDALICSYSIRFFVRSFVRPVGDVFCFPFLLFWILFLFQLFSVYSSSSFALKCASVRALYEMW